MVTALTSGLVATILWCSDWCASVSRAQADRESEISPRMMLKIGRNFMESSFLGCLGAWPECCKILCVNDLRRFPDSASASDRVTTYITRHELRICRRSVPHSSTGDKP